MVWRNLIYFTYISFLFCSKLGWYFIYFFILFNFCCCFFSFFLGGSFSSSKSYRLEWLSQLLDLTKHTLHFPSTLKNFSLSLRISFYIFFLFTFSIHLQLTPSLTDSLSYGACKNSAKVFQTLTSSTSLTWSYTKPTQKKTNLTWGCFILYINIYNIARLSYSIPYLLKGICLKYMIFLIRKVLYSL